MVSHVLARRTEVELPGAAEMICCVPGLFTSEVYGTAQYIPIDEKHPLHAQSPYSASKIGADAIATSFFCSFQLPVVIARPFNTYGPRQSARAVIPAIISQIATGAREIKLGDLTPTRDFTFVDVSAVDSWPSGAWILDSARCSISVRIRRSRLPIFLL
jgi:dTDP-D-glucose 4,6-dehydratase